MVQKAQLIDVMLSDGTFFRQLKYPGLPFIEIIDGEPKPHYDMKELKRFALKQCPSLSGKSFDVCLTNQRVY